MKRAQCHSVSRKRSKNGVVIRLLCGVQLLGLASGVPAGAFEVDGFRSGMNLDEALGVASEYDADVKPADRGEGLSIVNFARRRNTGKPAADWSLNFCGERLVGVLKVTYASGWPAAAAVIVRLNARYGEGSVKPVILPSGSGLQITWQGDAETVRLTFASWKGDGTAAEEALGELYQARGGSDDCSVIGPKQAQPDPEISRVSARTAALPAGGG